MERPKEEKDENVIIIRAAFEKLNDAHGMLDQVFRSYSIGPLTSDQSSRVALTRMPLDDLIRLASDYLFRKNLLG